MKLKSFMKVLLGALMISIGLNMFFMKFKLVPAGLFGFSTIYALKMDMNYSENIFLVNTFMFLLGYITISKKEIKKLIIPMLLVTLCVYLTSFIDTIVDLSSAETLLIAVFGAILIGFGERFIYQEEYYPSGDEIIEGISKAIIGPNGRIVNYVFDLILLVFVWLNFGLENTLYSSISIVLIEWMAKRSVLGISQDKVFYIITNEERKVKKFIMKELHYDLTMFDVKGGYSQNKNRIIMTAVPTKDYYKLREGIKEIDPSAFISITDSYEVINENIAIRK